MSLRISIFLPFGVRINTPIRHMRHKAKDKPTILTIRCLENMLTNKLEKIMAKIEALLPRIISIKSEKRLIKRKKVFKVFLFSEIYKPKNKKNTNT